MSNTILQVPMSKDLRDQAASAASKMGFSSLQETVRVFLSQLASKEVRINFETNTVRLSAKNEKRYSKMIEDIESGKAKTKTFTTVEALMQDLNSED